MFKARNVTRGFQNVYGIDYAGSFGLVVMITILRLFIALVATYDLMLHQINVKTAFPNRNLDERVYMEQPEWCPTNESPDDDCKLQNAFYSLKQAPRQWNANIDGFLWGLFGCSSCGYHPSFYVNSIEENLVLKTLCVDDLLLATMQLKTLLSLKDELSRHFEMEDCGETKLCLSLEIARKKSKRNLKFVSLCMQTMF